MTPRWRLLETWEPGAVQVCAGSFDMGNGHRQVNVKWAMLQWQDGERNTGYGESEPVWRDVEIAGKCVS